jgi:4-amino-4-deoxychorismate lyase
VTSTIPIKPPKFATVKSTNYLPNVLTQLEAEEAGAFTSIWLDQEGYIAEGPNMNVAFLSKNGVLMIPPFDNVLAGCTARRVLELVPKLVDENSLPGLVGVKIQRITVEEAKEAVEMMLIGSGVLVKPVVEWDGQPIGNGKNFFFFFFNLNPKWMAFNVESVS